MPLVRSRAASTLRVTEGKKVSLPSSSSQTIRYGANVEFTQAMDPFQHVFISRISHRNFILNRNKNLIRTLTLFLDNPR